MLESDFRRGRTPVSSWALGAFFAACVLLSGCAQSRQDFELAERAVDLFHSQLNSEQFSLIYQSADAKMKQSTSESDFVNFLQGVHRKLGIAQNSSERSKNFVYHNSQDATVILDYDTTFAQGSGTERFTWRVTNSHVALDSYKINSNELATK
jgi:hypothetical protein